MRVNATTTGRLALLLALLWGWLGADRLPGAAAVVTGELVTHGPTLGVRSLHPDMCVSLRAAPVPGGLDLVDKARATTVRLTPVHSRQGLQVEVVLAPEAAGKGREGRSVVFEMRDCKELHSSIEDGKDEPGAGHGDAYGHLELRCQSASGDGISGKVEFSHCG